STAPPPRSQVEFCGSLEGPSRPWQVLRSRSILIVRPSDQPSSNYSGRRPCAGTFFPSSLPDVTTKPVASSVTTLLARGSLMNTRRWFWLTMLVWFAIVGPAHAHFLFVRIGPPAEGGRSAEVYFSELAEAGDPRFIDKIAQTQLWLQTTPGKFEPLKVH